MPRFALLLPLLVAGCVTTPRRPPPAQDGHRGYLLHISGVGGASFLDRQIVQGLRSGGLDAHAEIYDWTTQRLWLSALRGYRRNQAHAAKVAARLADRARAAPGQPLYLVGESAGAAIAVWALEKLPAHVQVDAVLLLAPALSPHYDLTAALRHVAGRLIVVHSPGDTLVLGAGTRLWGTMDRVHTDAAGRVGFTIPPTADPAEYAKLLSLPYRPDWARFGNLGNHSGCMNQTFVRHVVAPLLRPGASPEM